MPEGGHAVPEGGHAAPEGSVPRTAAPGGGVVPRGTAAGHGSDALSEGSGPRTAAPGGGVVPDREGRVVRVVIAVAGSEAPTWCERLVRLLPAGGAGALELVLLHVIDQGPRALLEGGPPRHRAPWPVPARPHEERLAVADEEGAAALLALWRERCARAFPAASVASTLRRGRPEREIVEAARELAPDLVVVMASTRPGPPPPGPRSVGHVARYVLDHAPVPVLLVRRED